MKRSVLSACAAIVQKEIEFYAGFTCLEYDVNDENTMRVAGTGIFRSIIYANENQPYSAIEQAKTDRKPVFVRNRNSSIINEATGVARTILEMGERNASITFDLAVSMPMATPVTRAER